MNPKFISNIKTWKDKKTFGFTLIELLIVISVITMVSSAVLMNYRSGKIQNSLSQDTQKLMSELRMAQNLAISGIRVKEDYCGYGIEISPNPRPYSYRLYADVSPNCLSSNNKYDGSDDIIKTVELFSGIKFSSSMSSVDIFFKPPRPDTYINQDNTRGVDTLIILEAEDYDLSPRSIRVNTDGLVQSE